MYKGLTTNETTEKRNRTMGAETIQNKRVMLKNQTSRENFLRNVCLVLLATSIIFSGCKKKEDPVLPDKATLRYETVPYGSSAFGKSIVKADNEPYVLVASAKEHDNSVHYYLYYMGYVKSVPIAYKDAFRYDGTTPITIGYEKSWMTEESIMQSMTTAKEETWKVNASTTVGAEVTASAGAIFASVEVKASISATIGGEYGETVSTSNTYETSSTKINGETVSVSATIGENGQSAGRYRYALFGTTDVYCLFTVNPTTREIISVDITNRARETSYAWGIDFEPDAAGGFGKTGAGDLFNVPNIDFTQIAAPTLLLNEPPEPPEPDTKKTSLQQWTGIKQTKATKVKGDGDINSQNNRTTNWSLEIKNIRLINQRNDGTYENVAMDFIYIVSEGQSDWTELKMEVSHTFSISSRKVIELQGATTYKREGSLTGKNNSLVRLGSWSDGVIRIVDGQLDGSGNDENNIKFDANIYLEFIERNE